MYNYLVQIKGLNIPRLLNEIERKKITIKSIRRAAYDEIELEISSNMYKKLIDLKLLECYNINVASKMPQHKLIDMCLKRIGVLLGLLIAGYVVFSFTSKIWAINVSFSEEINGVTKETVIDILNDSGVKCGAALSVTTKQLENELLKNIEESSMVSVNKNGIYLEIFIKAREVKTELANTNIVSNYNGVITDVNYISGILTVNKGEAVVKGQVLIASGPSGDFYQEAIGTVFAKAKICGEAIGAKQTSSITRSGEFIEVIYYEVLGKYFGKEDVQTRASEAFLNYEIEESSEILFNNFLLPVKKVTAKIYELNETSINKSNAALITELKEKAYNDALNELPQESKVDRVSYDVFNEGELYKVVCTIESTINIGIRK